MAFVLVQHLAPDHKSILCELISRNTSMQVLEVDHPVSYRRQRPPCWKMRFEATGLDSCFGHGTFLVGNSSPPHSP